MSLSRVRSLTGLAFALPFFGVVACGGHTPKAESPSSSEHASSDGPAAVGQPAPDLSIQTLNGKGSFALAGMTGKVVVVDFWATWCEPCRKSFPALQEIAKRHPNELAILGVSVNDDSDGVAAFAKELGTTFPIGWDQGHSIAEKWKPTSMPSSYIVDASGTVRYVHSGFHAGDETKLEEEIASLLGKGPPPSEKSASTKAEVASDAKPGADSSDAASNPPPPAKPAKPAKKKKGAKKK